MTDQPPETHKIKANDNPWYCLATLYGEPARGHSKLRCRNRVAWNRFMASAIGEDRDWLIKAGRHSVDELTPFSHEEREAVGTAFAKRTDRPSGTKFADLLPGKTEFSNVDFINRFYAEGFVFPGRCNFSNATFSGQTDFRGATFLDGADFHGATFSGEANLLPATDFGGATFSGPTDFCRTTFSGDVDFDGATFGPTFFRSATFSDGVSFSGSTFFLAHFHGAAFSKWATFGGTTFDEVIFSGATFSSVSFNDANLYRVAVFHGTTFSDGVSFSGSTFGRADFLGATFSGQTNFCRATFESKISFVNVELKNQTDFTAAKFLSNPPTFFGAKLHEGTVWRDVCWPPRPMQADEAGYFVDAYERLKLEMDRLKKHDDELNFFARELQCRRVLLGYWKGLPIEVYGFLCDYGRSYSRPLLLLVATVFLGTFFFAAHLVGYWTPLLSNTGHTGQAIGISFANTFGVLGIRKDFIDANVLQNLPTWLKVVSIIQTIFGIVLLFLFGLGIRNCFRMK